MDYLYSLYDALVSINVPSDKARAVVDAMERDMGTTLATKQDLQLLATKTESMSLNQDVQLLRQEMASMRTELRQEIENRCTLLAHEFTTLRGDVSRDLKTLGLKMTVSLGSMLMVGFGLTIAALRIWL
ncbi:MAG: hypothetical protein ACREQZ_15375 [Woeseiaceae bacterium]